MGVRAGSSDELRVFRERLYSCMDRRSDALFELSDAILAAGVVPSPAHLSLSFVHRRGWGSLYAALSNGWLQAEALRDLLVCHPLGYEPDRARVYAVDHTSWPRCDAETSPGRGYYYHPNRHSAGQPIVAGWCYQLVAELGFERDSWVAPVDVRRVPPDAEANDVAAESNTGIAEFRDTLALGGHASGCAETLRQVSRQTQRQSLRTGETVSGDEKGRIKGDSGSIKPPGESRQGLSRHLLLKSQAKTSAVQLVGSKGSPSESFRKLMRAFAGGLRSEEREAREHAR